MSPLARDQVPRWRRLVPSQGAQIGLVALSVADYQSANPQLPAGMEFAIPSLASLPVNPAFPAAAGEQNHHRVGLEKAHDYRLMRRHRPILSRVHHLAGVSSGIRLAYL